MPACATAMEWLRDHADFADLYARAIEQRADWLAEDIIDLSDQPLPRLDDGRIDGGRVQQMRLQVDARKWIASKLWPRKYGEASQNIQINGGQVLIVGTGVPRPDAITSTEPTDSAIEHIHNQVDKPQPE